MTSSIHTVSSSVKIAYQLHHPATTSNPPRPTIILINGLTDPKESWLSQTPAFTAAGYTVLIYDNRGIGASSRPTESGQVYTASDMANDLASLIRGVGIRGEVHILGISMGGMITQTFALEHVLPGTIPEINVLSVTLACTYAAPNTFCTRMFNYWSHVAQKLNLATVMQDLALWCFTPAFFDSASGKEVLAEYDAEVAKIDDVAQGGMGIPAYLAQMNVILKFDSRKQLKGLADRIGKGGPEVIVLVGENDILIPVPLSRELHELIPGSKWQTTKGGHACNWEEVDAFNQICLDTWKVVEGRRRS
ncbi:hypothetical protein B0A52_07498 [Exophiala mesophila]|uniref:AB hydrolase-1 domain-containing protein n=1 Tax=Exophiala mesophila TaxID=212818 RepID=A0A438MYM6_EXOME|nr:hypothetical protein B0A52_07498 [Exophiala mesophila]